MKTMESKTELPPAKAGGLAQSGATTKVVRRTCLNAHESTHDSQSHRLKPVVFTKCVDNNKLIVVLGMHRSGTSAIARGLQVIGARLGDRLMPPNEEINAKGFWEDLDINALNIEMLSVIGSDWHHLAPIEFGDIEVLRKRGYFHHASELLRQKISNVPIFGFKDPRVTKLLPFWQEVFSHCKLDVSYVLALRHPLSVANSLEKRDNFDSMKSHMLWLAHVVSSLLGTADNKRVLVDYDRLMQSPNRELNRIAQCIGLEIDTMELQSYKSEFLDQSLRHTVYGLDDLTLDDNCPPIVCEVYAALLDVASEKTNFDDMALQHKIVRWSDEFERLKLLLLFVDRLFTEKSIANQAVAERDGQIASLDQAVAERDVQIASLNQAVAESNHRFMLLEREISEQQRVVQAQANTIAELKDSFSWRVTRPLRFVGRQGRKAKDVQAVTHRLLQRDSLLALSKKLLRVLRHEGLRGVKARVRQQHYLTTHAVEPSVLLPPTKLGFSLEPAAIVRDRQGHYALAAASSGYTYIEPQRPADLDTQLETLKSARLFSIVVPVYNTPIELLDALLASVQTQWYPHWQLVLADDASPDAETRKALARIDHPQIKVLFLEKNLGIAGATNAAIEAASGDFIVFMDHDDELTVDCLYELALCIEREQPDFIYSDEDKITALCDYSEPHFKPDWSPDTMMSTMFTCHVSSIRRSLLDKVGGLRSQFDGCQDWDFVLRVTEQTERISHIPKVLYHWRIIPGSIASDIAAKSYILDASKRVREDALVRRSLVATVEPVEQISGYFRVAYQLQGNPQISIIIPTRDNEKILRRCIDSILQTTGYRHFELVILDNGSVEPATVAYLQQIAKLDNIKVIRHNAPFNFSELNNIGVRAAAGELLLFLNDDTEVLQQDWLERLGGFAQLAHVGAVGAKLLYPGRKQVQHAGILNLEDGPGHAFLMHDCDAPGYYMRNLLEYNWLAVTGACLMVSRSKFEAIGGFCESLPVAYNDIDLCMRLHDAGFYNVVCQAVRLTHHESASRGFDNVNPAKIARLQRDLAHLYERNPGYFQRDPFHNPNLHPYGINFEVPA